MTSRSIDKLPNLVKSEVTSRHESWVQTQHMPVMGRSDQEWWLVSDSPGLACERRRISSCHLVPPKIFGGTKWQPEKHLHSQASAGPSITKLFLLTLKYLFTLYQQDVDSFIDHKAALDKRKKQMLFKKWSERVYTPVKVSQSLYWCLYFTLVDFNRKRII